MQDVRIDRWKYIGGSDIPVIMGLVNYGKTRWDLLQEKAQLWNDDFDGNIYTEYGNAMEPVIRDYINFKYEADFIEDKRIDGDFRYHADGYDKDKKTVLEIKTTGEAHNTARDYKHYLVQLLFGMATFGVADGILAVYLRPDDMNEDFDSNRLSIFEIDIADYKDILDEISVAVEKFIVDMNYLRQNLESSESDMPSVNSIVPLANKVAQLEQQMVAFKELEKNYKKFKSELKTAMENAAVKSFTLEDSGIKFTLVFDQEDKIVKKFDESAFAAEHVELYEEYLKDKIQKGKSGYVRITMPGEKGEENE